MSRKKRFHVTDVPRGSVSWDLGYRYRVVDTQLPTNAWYDAPILLAGKYRSAQDAANGLNDRVKLARLRKALNHTEGGCSNGL
jgi:hypothetical protein